MRFVGNLMLCAFFCACGNGEATPEEHAERFCEHAISCNPDDFESVPSCVQDELANLEDAQRVSEECYIAEGRLLRCLNDLSCAILSAYFDEAPDYPCSIEEEVADQLCNAL